ncbi:hypothetical protein K440DRAFT_636271 [Wilcoxina mikolae CBS 423.85]|nr:hypothetical protein K440DRAFT_636271 [Wilcoxina mikolae CBS 423.85]
MPSQHQSKVQGKEEFDIRRTEMSANNLAMNFGKFDAANYNKWSGQVELLLESKHVLGVVTGDLKKSEALAENASASERLVHAMLRESYVDKQIDLLADHGGETSARVYEGQGYQGVMGRTRGRLQVKSQEVDVPHLERTFANEASDIAEDDGKVPAV